MGSIKDRNGMDLREAKDTKKRWQEYTEELYKKDLHDPDNHDGVITDLGPDVLEFEVKWALESITMNKANGGDGIPVELPGFLPGKSHGQRSLVGYSPWGCQELYMTEQLSIHACMKHTFTPSFFKFYVDLQCCVSFRCTAK